MNISLGRVSKIEDPLKFIIRFTIEEVIEDCIAYPIDTFDELNEGDPVLLYEIESIFGFSYLYKKLRLYDYTRLKLKDSQINIKEDIIEIFHKGSIIRILDNEDIEIEAKSNIKVTSEKDINIEAQSNCTVKSPKVKITGGQLDTKGQVAPTGSGPYCGITVCPFVGLPHVGPTVTGT